MNGTEVEKLATPKLTPQQKIGAAMVAAGRTDSEIAQEVNVANSTVATWRKRPAFQAEVNRIIGELQKGIVRRAYAAVPKAMEYLVSVLDDPTASHTQRIQAAKTLIDRFPAFTPDLATEPTPEIHAALTVLPPAPPAEETLLEVYKIMREIEQARAQGHSRPSILSGYEDDDEDQDDEHDERPRVIRGELASEGAQDDERESEPAPVRNISHRRPKVEKGALTDRELEVMARARGGLGGGLRGGGY